MLEFKLNRNVQGPKPNGSTRKQIKMLPKYSSRSNGIIMSYKVTAFKYTKLPYKVIEIQLTH